MTFTDIFSITVGLIGITSLIISMYLWYYFHQSTRRMSLAVKWILATEGLATLIALIYWSMWELNTIHDITRCEAHTLRFFVFLSSMLSSSHMIHQIRKTEEECD